jgi:AGZA family xanthine/uracil permease-like MFS transporter
MSYIILNTFVWVLEKASGGKIKPKDKDEHKEPWTWRIEGGVLPPWVSRLGKGKKDFWKPYDDEEHHGVAGRESSSEDMDEEKVVGKTA